MLAKTSTWCAVAGHGRLERVREIFLALLFVAHLRLAQRSISSADGFSRSVPLLPSRMTGVPLASSERARSMPASAGNTERAREDGDVRGRAAAHGGKTHDPPALHRGGVRGREILGDENGVGRIGGSFPLDAGEEFEHAHADVAQVVGALREQLIAQTGEPLGVGLDGAFPGEGGALALGDRGVGDLEEIGIVEQLGVRGEDGGLRRILWP